MRITIGFCLLMTGCCILKSHAVEETYQSTTETIVASSVEVSESPSVEGSESTPIDVATLFRFNIEDMQTPEQILAEELPELDAYHINTRIVIEGQVVEIDHEGAPVTGVWWSREMADIWRDLKHAEEIYKNIGVKFHVSDISFQEYKPSILERFLDAHKTPDILTITYMLPNSFIWEGYSAAPWEVLNRGVVIHYLADEWTLAHELGHYFGLLHPWDEDCAKDTPEQTQKFCTGPEFSTPNCHNIMNYCEHEPKHITPDQVVRFRRFLRDKRMNQYVREYTDLMLRSDKIPSPAGTTVIFNFSLENGQINAFSELENP